MQKVISWLIDSHCHLHDKDFYEGEDIDNILHKSIKMGVKKIMVVGTSIDSSHQALDFALKHDNVFVALGIHPHDTEVDFSGYADFATWVKQVVKKYPQKVIAIGEIGLDYFYMNSKKQVQQDLLKKQIELANEVALPISFHVRDAFDDFWSIFDSFTELKGVLHSFTDSLENMKKGIDRGLFIGVNGISTFTKDESQKCIFDKIPLEKMLLETDAPFLTPVPFRGKLNMPGYLCEVAKYHAERRSVDFSVISRQTSRNFEKLFLGKQ